MGGTGLPVPPVGIVGGGVGFWQLPAWHIWPSAQQPLPHWTPSQSYWQMSAALQPTGTPLGITPQGVQLAPQLSTERTSHEPSPQRRALPAHSHLLALHSSSASHAVVQLPQKSSLERVSTHIVPHIMLGAAQSGRHMPPMHEVPSLQSLPHVPQFRSVFSGTHVGPPQRSWPVGQSQRPPVHITPLGHRVPHAPQFSWSVWVLVQIPLHRSSIGAVHMGRHMPPMHVVPLPHIVVQLPQYWLVFSGVHALVGPPH
jgi:hypothetical protein